MTVTKTKLKQEDQEDNQTHRTRQAMFDSSKYIDKPLAISPRKSSGIFINVPERVAQNAQGLTGHGKGKRKRKRKRKGMD